LERGFRLRVDGVLLSDGPCAFASGDDEKNETDEAPHHGARETHLDDGGVISRAWMLEAPDHRIREERTGRGDEEPGVIVAARDDATYRRDDPRSCAREEKDCTRDEPGDPRRMPPRPEVGDEARGEDEVRGALGAKYENLREVVTAR
jgi:hypothetical protein